MKKSKKIIINGIIVLFAVAVAFLTGCDSEEDGVGSGDLIVRWDIAGLKMCRSYLPAGGYDQDDLQFDTVVVGLYESAVSPTPIQELPPLSCTDFQTNFERLPHGDYFVRIKAYAMYNEQSIPFFVGSGEVSHQTARSVLDLPLEVADGQLVVRWYFNGNFTCGLTAGGEVANVIVSLNGVQRAPVPCGNGQIVINNVYPENEYRVSAQALDGNGTLLYEAVSADNPFEVLPGQPYTVNVLFQ